MASSISTEDLKAAFLAGCINETRTLRHVYESLGLYSQTLDPRKETDFHKNEANELYKRIKQIVKAFLTCYRGDADQLRADLATDTTFSNEVVLLGHLYGQTLWSRLEEGEIRSSGESQSQGGVLEELDWDKSNDRKAILFYLRCWLVSVAIKEFPTTSHKCKGKNRMRTPDKPQGANNNVEYLSDSSGPSDVPCRAPEARTTLPNAESRGDAAQQFSANRRSFNAINMGADSKGASVAKRTDNTSPAKRKAQDLPEQARSMKSPKSFQGTRVVPVPVGKPTRDNQKPPTGPVNLGRSLFDKPRYRETTFDTDTTWVPPREATAETETVVDGDEVGAEEVDSILQSAIPIISAESMQYVYEVRPIAGPSGTYQNPLRRDSVIPADTQTQYITKDSDLEPTRGLAAPVENTVSSSLDDAITRSFITYTSDPTGWQQREYRRELFKLLLSHLNGLNEFSTASYNMDAEERMNFLLNQFWVNDTEALQTLLGEAFTRLHVALETWTSMRHHLARFRSATDYFGQPGDQWRDYLRCLDDVPCAHATLAYVDLQGFASEASAKSYVVESFDGDLALVFDAVTRLKGCNGVEAFKGVRRYNEALLVWFQDGGI